MVYGTLSYDSVFGAHHSINFCAASTEVEFSGPKECFDYNDVDSTEEPYTFVLPSDRRQQDEPMNALT